MFLYCSVLALQCDRSHTVGALWINIPALLARLTEGAADAIAGIAYSPHSLKMAIGDKDVFLV